MSDFCPWEPVTLRQGDGFMTMQDVEGNEFDLTV